ncbi:MAG TPA: redoxin domain-containing protein [Gaiellaceae bacterium]|jgi:cytochrome c biogenesis protein CcmG/thiol:disulfide interchange protein DsbE|nr:redoxin domain-containing protein [Gaiellaceae bacterium]
MAGRLKLTAQVLALALVTGLFALLVWKLATQDEGAAPKLGRGETPPAPGFTLDRLDRPGKLSLASYRGRPVIINFWASWCIPCKEEAPLLESVWKQYRGRGLVVLGVDINDVRGEARRFARENRMSYPLVYDGPGETTTDYGLTGVPETFFVARSGRLVCDRLQAGVHLKENKERFEECVQEVLGA